MVVPLFRIVSIDLYFRYPNGIYAAELCLSIGDANCPPHLLEQDWIQNNGSPIRLFALMLQTDIKNICFVRYMVGRSINSDEAELSGIG